MDGDRRTAWPVEQADATAGKRREQHRSVQNARSGSRAGLINDLGILLGNGILRADIRRNQTKRQS
jgi:hypothetical protein